MGILTVKSLSRLYCINKHYCPLMLAIYAMGGEGGGGAGLGGHSLP